MLFQRGDGIGIENSEFGRLILKGPKMQHLSHVTNGRMYENGRKSLENVFSVFQVINQKLNFLLEK